jgi:Uma2 family endonuclease
MAQAPPLQQAFVSPTEDESLYEVIDGERREAEPMSAREVALASFLISILGNFAQQHRLGWAVAEMLFLLDRERNLQRRPDVAFVSYARWGQPAIPTEEAWDVVPDLAVEVVSRTNRAVEIEAKLLDYFAAGVSLVWVVYPDSGRVLSYESLKQIRVLDRQDDLDGGPVLPGFRLSIQSLFDATTKPA